MLAVLPLAAQETAVDAANAMALGLAGSGLNQTELMAALEGAAAAGQPMALWQLGVMYENGEGVERDPVKAFGYFSQIANEHADAAPRSFEADIVAQSFVKMGEYYRDGLPGAGIVADADRSHALVMHAATYFGDPDAQYMVGQLYLSEEGLGFNPLQSARWLRLAARKGHYGAQASLGSLLFNGTGIQRAPVEGLMWLTIANRSAPQEVWITDALMGAMSIATPEERTEAVRWAEMLPQGEGGYR